MTVQCNDSCKFDTVCPPVFKARQAEKTDPCGQYRRDVSEVVVLRPGPTLSDSVGLRRIKMLEDSRANLIKQIRERGSKIHLINHEISELLVKEEGDARLIAELKERHGRY